MTNFQGIIDRIDLDERHDEFFETETIIESVDAEGMEAIIEGIENGKVVGDDSNEESLEGALEKNDEQATTSNAPTKPDTPNKPELNNGSQQQQNAENSGSSAVTEPTNDQPQAQQQAQQQEPAPTGLFEQKFPKIFDRIKTRFNNAPDELEKLMKFLNKKNVVAKISDALEKIGNEPVMIDHKAVAALVKYYNKNNKDQIALPFRNANIDDNATSNVQLISNIKIPSDFNKAPATLGERCTSTRFGYPLINFGSETVKEMLKQATDLDYLKTLTKEFVKEIKDTPIADALGTRTMLNTWKMIVKRVRECGRSKCIPAVHKPLKVSGGDNIEDLFNGAQSEDGMNKVAVSPINTRSNKITESVDNVAEDAIMEGLVDYIKGGKGGDPKKNSFIDGPEIEVPIPYLAQFYKINKPSSPEGMEKYTRYMSDEDMQNILSNISEEAANAAKQSNGSSYKAALLAAYVKEHDGVLPYYILTQRSEPKERIRITPKPLLRGMYFVKSVDGPNKATGYFISKDEREQLFELG